MADDAMFDGFIIVTDLFEADPREDDSTIASDVDSPPSFALDVGTGTPGSFDVSNEDSGLSSYGTSPESSVAFDEMSASATSERSAEPIGGYVAAFNDGIHDDAADVFDQTHEELQPPTPHGAIEADAIDPRLLDLQTLQAMEGAAKAQIFEQVKHEPHVPPSHRARPCEPCGMIIQGGIKNLRSHNESDGHLRRVQALRPRIRWMCTICDLKTRFTRKDGLKRHIYNDHPWLCVFEDEVSIVPEALLQAGRVDCAVSAGDMLHAIHD